ncbi:MAG: GspH/FimT family pseudopilin [Sideroxydans sp.]|nr:GspH/FimT family pseudopilin [Sideroxydans sp.]
MSTCQKSGQFGFSLAELMLSVVILGILSAVAFPSLKSMLRDSQVRNAAEAITNGLQRARGEAVARNTNVSFILGTGSAWVIRDANEMIESRLSGEGSKDVTVTVTGSSTIIFNNVGGVVGGGGTQFDLETEGSARPLRVTIGIGGNARMCDPKAPSTSTSAC